MTEQEQKIQTYAIASKLYKRLKYIAIYGNKYISHPTNMELVEEWEKFMNELTEEDMEFDS